MTDLVDLPEIQVATQNPTANPTSGQRLYLRSDTGSYWIAAGGSWVGPYINLTLGTSSTTAGRGDYTETAYNHSQSAHAPSNAQKNSDITKAEIEAKLTGTVTTHNHDGRYFPQHDSASTDYVSVIVVGEREQDEVPYQYVTGAISGRDAYADRWSGFDFAADELGDGSYSRLFCGEYFIGATSVGYTISHPETFRNDIGVTDLIASKTIDIRETAFIDESIGDDNTGIIGDPSKQFATIDGALAAGYSSVLWFGPGNYLYTGLPLDAEYYIRGAGPNRTTVIFNWQGANGATGNAGSYGGDSEEDALGGAGGPGDTGGTGETITFDGLSLTSDYSATITLGIRAGVGGQGGQGGEGGQGTGGYNVGGPGGQGGDGGNIEGTAYVTNAVLIVDSLPGDGGLPGVDGGSSPTSNSGGAGGVEMLTLTAKGCDVINVNGTPVTAVFSPVNNDIADQLEAVLQDVFATKHNPVFTGIVAFPGYYTTALPWASVNNGKTIRIIDYGNRLCTSNGTHWLDQNEDYL